ncbi:MAG: transcriptional regulator NrdR [Lentisphaeria bacterium]|jgi:transcriptional repressor NrdR
MRCPKCSCLDDKVLDTRISKEGDSIRRRRECARCGARFTTYEMVMRTDILVVKRDGTREEFSPEKLKAGIRKACWKRPVSEGQIDAVLKRIADRLENLQDREISSQMLGELVMGELQKVDEVAYVRFASVYRRFKDVNEFISEISEIRQQSDRTKS